MASLSEIIGGDTGVKLEVSIPTYSDGRSRRWPGMESEWVWWAYKHAWIDTVCVKKKCSFYLRLNMTKRVNEFLDLGWFRYIYLSTASVFVCFVLCVHACVCVCAQTLDVFWHGSYVWEINQCRDYNRTYQTSKFTLTSLHLVNKCNSDKSEEFDVGMYNVAGPAPCQTCAGPLCCNHVQHDWKERKANDSKCIQKQGDHWFIAAHCQPCFIYARILELLIGPHSILPHGDTPGTSNQLDRVRLLRMAGGSVIHLP